MKYISLVLILGLGLSELSQAQGASSTLRRTYPGGRDDGDLTVQPVRKITRKGEEIDVDYHGTGEPTQNTAEPSGGESPQGE